MKILEYPFQTKYSKMIRFSKIFVSFNNLGLVLTGSGTPALVGVDTVGGSGDFGVPGVLGVGVLGG